MIIYINEYSFSFKNPLMRLFCFYFRIIPKDFISFLFYYYKTDLYKNKTNIISVLLNKIKK